MFVDGIDVVLRIVIVEKILYKFCDEKMFVILLCWCNELKFIYGFSGEFFFKVDCVVVFFFGVVLYGIYWIVFICSDDGYIKLWVKKCL